MISKTDLENRSEFRYRLTRFLRFGEQAAQAQDVTFSQYLLLLHVKGTRGRSWALVGELAERLQLRHHSTVELVSRCEAAELVERRRAGDDKREVQIHLTRMGERTLKRVAAAQTEELLSLLNAFVQQPLEDLVDAKPPTARRKTPQRAVPVEGAGPGAAVSNRCSGRAPRRKQRR